MGCAYEVPDFEDNDYLGDVDSCWCCGSPLWEGVCDSADSCEDCANN